MKTMGRLPPSTSHPHRRHREASPITIDGSHGEGGGQLVRTAVALAAVTGRTLKIDNIRAKRSRPGLAAQHLAAVGAVGALCSARIEGLALCSTALTFAPGPLHGGSFAVDIGTAGSVTLVLQALLPALVACGERTTVALRGGTDVRAAPPLDYFGGVSLRLLGYVGVRAELTARRRGYFPQGGGEIALTVSPSRLHAVDLTESGTLKRVRGVAHVAGIDFGVAQRMRDAFVAHFGMHTGIVPQVEAMALAAEQARGAGGAIAAWAETEHTTLGAGRVAERGVRAETLGAAVGDELRDDLAAGVTLDGHAADQFPVYLALAGGGSFSTRTLSSHAQTAIWLIEQFLPVRFQCVQDGTRMRVRVAPRAGAG
jgi:RNA 3'-terminal phosphate cyclase (ATP)